MPRKPEDKPLVSYIIPCYRSHRTIGFTLQSIDRQLNAPDYEVIVVDSSAEETTEWLKAKFPRVQFQICSERLSPGAARNLGAQLARGNFLAFLDADVVAGPNWIDTLLGVLKSSGDLCTAGAPVGNANPQTLSSKLLHWCEFSEFLPGLGTRNLPFLSSSNLLIRRQDFFSTGGFPETLAMGEDLLFFQRFKGQVSLIDSTRVGHYQRSRWKEVLNHLKKLGYWSGRIRAATQLSGTWLRQVPIAAHGLPMYRTPLIISRVCLSSWRSGLLAILLAPFILWAMVSWSRGFYRGLTEGDVESLDLSASL